MQATRALLQQRQPMIRFLGRRGAPPKPAPAAEPQPHPASPTHSLPDSFASYRQKAIQHGPLGPRQTETSATAPGFSRSSIDYTAGSGIGARSGRSLGSVEPKQGEYFDRDDLPARFRRSSWSAEEMEAIESGGASVVV